MEDLNAAGGVPAVMAQLAELGQLDTSLPTVTGKTVGENIAGAKNLDETNIRPTNNPHSKNRRHCHSVGQHRQRRLRGQAQRRCARNAGAQRPGPGVRQ